MVCNPSFYDDGYGAYKSVSIHARRRFKVHLIIFYGEKSPVMYDWVNIVLSLSIKKSEFGRNLNLRESNF